MGTGDQQYDGGIPGDQPADASAMAPAGWYPIDGGGQRYWDGAAWTEHIVPAPDPTPPGPAAAPGYPGGSGPQPSPQGLGDRPLSGAPGAGFPPGVGDPQPVWGAAPGVPYGQSQPAPAYGQGGVVPSTADDRSMALLCHVLAIFTGFLGPLIVWAIKKDQSRFVDYHGKQALNFQFSMLLYWVVAFFSIFILVGLLLVPVLMLLGIILPIMAAVAANRGEMYQYPLTIKFFS